MFVALLSSYSIQYNVVISIYNYATLYCIYHNHNKNGSVAKNLALLQNQWIPSQLGNLINIITDKRAHKGKNCSLKLRKYYFCTRTVFITSGVRRVTVRQESSFMHQLLMHEMCYATEKMRIGSSDSHYRM